MKAASMLLLPARWLGLACLTPFAPEPESPECDAGCLGGLGCLTGRCRVRPDDSPGRPGGAGGGPKSSPTARGTDAGPYSGAVRLARALERRSLACLGALLALAGRQVLVTLPMLPDEPDGRKTFFFLTYVCVWSGCAIGAQALWFARRVEVLRVARGLLGLPGADCFLQQRRAVATALVCTLWTPAAMLLATALQASPQVQASVPMPLPLDALSQFTLGWQAMVVCTAPWTLAGALLFAAHFLGACNLALQRSSGGGAVRAARCLHLRVVECAERAVAVAGPLVLLSSCVSFLGLIRATYTLAKGLRDLHVLSEAGAAVGPALAEATAGGMDATYNLSLFCAPVFACEVLLKQNRRIKRTVLTRIGYTPLECFELRLFVLQLRNVQPHLSACDLFSLEYPAVHAVIVAAVTYTVILIDM